ncbi:MAG: hypothetical protein J5662_03580 [Clostridia bacterium]|nr:hypothetical protein [Clostridia bacterium]
MKKIISLFLAAIIPVLCLSGCGNNKGSVYDKNSKFSVLESGTVAENDSFELSFDSANNSVKLLCKEDSKVWSTYPEDATDENETVTIWLRVQDTNKKSETKISDASANRIGSERIKEGVKITYYFDEYEISVPVCYSLRKDSMLVSINGSEICQSGKRYLLIAAQPAPMLCRVSIEAEDSYLFLTSGISGIISNKCNAERAVSYSEFGGSNIASMSIESQSDSPDSCKCKCFGVKDGKDAAFCIGESSAYAFSLNMLSGDKSKMYSVAYPTFFFTDFDYYYGVSKLHGQVKQVSDLYTGTVSMGFYPLFGEDADYNGMAKCYREYLIKAGYISENKTVEESSPYSVTYLGGIEVGENVLGVSTTELKCMTSIADAKEFTEKLTKETGYTPIVRLAGYGKSGINIGEVAGGYEFSSKLGNDSARKEFEEYIKSKKSSVFTDFGVIFYRESGSGFSYSGSAAKTAIHHVAELSPVNTPLRDFNNEMKYRLLSRRNLITAVDKLVKFANKSGISGVSFNDLGGIFYSDYSNGTEYGVSAKIDSDTKNCLMKLSKAGHKVAVSSGAYFSTGISDVVFDAPTEPSGRLMYVYEIPFYQMVFHGITPIYSTSVNTAADIKYNTMLAASSGTGIGFSFIKNYDSSFENSEGHRLYAMKFEDNYGLVKSTLEKYAGIYDSVANSKILRYDVLEHEISKTTFENGVCIYANHSAYPQNSPVGIIDGYDYCLGGESDR